MKTMIFDGQVFQSAAWDRGMGKYSLSLVAALQSDKRYDYDKTYIVLSKHFELKDEARKVLEKLVPKAELVFLDLQLPNIHDHRTIEPIMKHNKRTLDAFVTSMDGATSIDFVILSLFIDQVCSIFPTDVRKVLLFYDLIPLQYNERYGVFHNYDNYLRRFKTILDADIIWTISQTVADDLMVYMGISPKKLFNINGAPIPREEQAAVKPQHVEIPERFLLMPSGNDLRKNNDRAVEAVKAYNEFHKDDKIALVITSFFDDGTRDRLRQKSNDLVFTGNVSEIELRWLYENAEAVLFVPEYEGLGLPILEGAEVDKPIICSNLTVFNEMSETAFYYADQFSPLSICKAIEHALKHDGFSAKRKLYAGILKRYTWRQSAADALKSLKPILERKDEQKRRLAIFAPDPSSYSAIGKSNIYLHPALSEYFDIDYYVENGVTDQPGMRPSYLWAIAPVYDAKSFNASTYKKYDAVVYHIGNSEFHLETIKNALYLPGIAIMHDVFLKAIFEGELLSRGYISQDRLTAEEKLNSLLKTDKTSHAASIVGAQLAAIAHSDYSRRVLAEVAPKDVTVHMAQHPIATPRVKKSKITSRVSIGFAGIIHPAKGLGVLDDIQSSGLFDDADIYIFGKPLLPEDELARLGSMHNVTILTNLTDFQFQSKLADIDILVNYRPHYNGEASASTLESMRFGVVPIVRRIGWYDELPDDAVLKVDDQAEIVDALYGLCHDKAKREAMSARCREVTEAVFDFEAYARTLYDMVSELQGSKSLNGRIAKALRAGEPKTAIEAIVENSKD